MLMYGSIFCRVTRRPRASISAPIDAAARPFPRDETTPPVTKMYLGGKSPLLSGCRVPSVPRPCADKGFLVAPFRHRAVQARVAQRVQRGRHARTRRDAERDDVVTAKAGARPRRLVEPLDVRARARRIAEREPRQLQRTAPAQPARARAR